MVFEISARCGVSCLPCPRSVVLLGMRFPYVPLVEYAQVNDLFWSIPCLLLWEAGKITFAKFTVRIC